MASGPIRRTSEAIDEEKPKAPSRGHLQLAAWQDESEARVSQAPPALGAVCGLSRPTSLGVTPAL